MEFVLCNSYFLFLVRLTFQFNPSSKVYGYVSYDLKPDGENVVILSFCLLPTDTEL